MIRFDDSIIDDCYFYNITILCYEPHTCKTIHLKDKALNDHDTESEFNICTKEEIDNIKNPKEEKKDSSLIIIGGVIIGCIIVICNIILVIFLLMRERESKDSNSRSSTGDNNLFRNGSISITLNNNNSRSNTNAGINSNNSYNDNNNYNNSQNNLDHSYFNQNIIVNTMGINNMSMNVDSKNEMNIYMASAIDENEPPPEYSEINNLI